MQRAFDSTQIGGILRALMRRGYAVIEDVHPRAAPPASRRRADGRATPAATSSRTTGPPAVIAAVDRAALLRLADADRRLRRGASRSWASTSRPGRVVLRISGAHADPSAALARRVFVLARQRTIDQDPAFALRMLVDIAIRALSPAVNDPTTAVQVLDRHRGAARRARRAPPGPSLVVDDDGRAARARPGARRGRAYVELGLMEIRRYGAESPQVVRRLHALYDRLLEVVDERERAAHRARAPAARRSGSPSVPRPGGARDRGAGRTGSGLGGAP